MTNVQNLANWKARRGTLCTDIHVEGQEALKELARHVVSGTAQPEGQQAGDFCQSIVMLKIGWHNSAMSCVQTI
jgi:hypothetical protein